MKVTQEKLPASQVALNIEISAAASQQAYDDVVKSLSRTVRLPGFRQGKVPRQILLQRLGSQRVRAEALEKLVQDTLNKAFDEVELEVLGNYQLISSFDDLLEQYQPGEPLTLSASVDVQPEVDLGDYQQLQITAEEVVYDPQQVEEFLEQKRSQVATLVPVEGRAAQWGDVAVIHYQGYLATETGELGEAIAGAEAKDFEIEIERGEFIEDLVEGLVGMELGAEKRVPVCFPEGYAREDLADRDAFFDVTLVELKEKELPELDDEFAAEVSEFETMAALRDHLEQQYRDRAKQTTQNNIEGAISEALSQQAQIDLPKTLVEREIDNRIRHLLADAERLYGIDPEIILSAGNEFLDHMREESRPVALKTLTVSLALQEIARRESLKPEEPAVDERIQELLGALEGERIDLKRLRSIIEEELAQNLAMTWLREHAAVTLVPEGTLSKAAEAEAATATVDVESEPAEEPESAEAATATVDVGSESAEEQEPAEESEPAEDPAAEAKA